MTYSRFASLQQEFAKQEITRNCLICIFLYLPDIIFSWVLKKNCRFLESHHKEAFSTAVCDWILSLTLQTLSGDTPILWMISVQRVRFHQDTGLHSPAMYQETEPLSYGPSSFGR